MLIQVVRAPDPLAHARQLRLNVKDDKVQVLLVLDREDVNFLSGYGAEVGTQSGTQAQASVPVNRICEPARTEEVLAIRVPARVIPQQWRAWSAQVAR
ncbi:MAG: hypothetical protein ACUVX1_17955 [Chloroflexota bacterium]